MRRSFLVTGASGFTGTHLLDHLAAHEPEAEIVALSLSRGVTRRNVIACRTDLNDFSAVLEIVRDHEPTVVFHLAAAMPPSTPSQMWTVNVGGTVSLFCALGAAHVKPRCLVVGSSAEYMPCSEARVPETADTGGASEYGRSKWAQTELAATLARRYGIGLVVARTFNLVGPGQDSRFVVGALCEQARGLGRGGWLEVGNTDAIRDFVDVRDAVRAYHRLATSLGASGVYNVCSSRATSIEEVVQAVLRVKGEDLHVKHDAGRARPGEVHRMVGDNRKIRDAVGWSPGITLEQTLHDMLRADP